MARNFKKVSKTSPTSTPRVKNKESDRGGMVKVEKTETGINKKVFFKVKYTQPVPFSSEFPRNMKMQTVTQCHIRAILQCDVRLDGLKVLSGIILCPYRKQTLKTLLFKFDVNKFHVAEVVVLRSVGIANE